MYITSSNTVTIAYLDSVGYNPLELDVSLTKGGIVYGATYSNSKPNPSLGPTGVTHTFTSQPLANGVYKVEVFRKFVDNGRELVQSLSVNNFRHVSFNSTFNLLNSSFGYIGSSFTTVVFPVTPDLFEENEVPSVSTFKAVLSMSMIESFYQVKEFEPSSNVDRDGYGELVVVFDTPTDSTYRFTIYKESVGTSTKVGTGSGIRPITTDIIYIS